MEKITYSLEDGIAQITMDDGKANSMNWIFFEEMGKAWIRPRMTGRSYL